jgi:hypothetical protein
MNLERPVAVGALLGVLVATGIAGCRHGGDNEGKGVPLRDVADYVHTVIEADRTTYAREVVQRLQDEEGVLRASEHFKQDKALPLPAQMLRMGARRASEAGRMRYSLLSLWAINKTNLPKTDFERQGLQAVVDHPDRTYTSFTTVGNTRYFLAVYPDRAVSPACVSCHNHHSQSPRHDFREGDVMGGVVISIPASE